MYDISVIIPTFRPSSYIFDCLNSLKNQQFPKEHFEIVLILNGDKEPYYTLIYTYVNVYFIKYNVKLLHTDIAGVSNARNIGIEQSNGKYIAFVDDDDIVSESYLLEMYSIALKNKIPLSYIKAFTTSITGAFDYFITRAYEKNVNKKLSILNTRSFFSTPCCKLLNREIIGNARFDIRFKTGEDALFMFLISDKMNEMQFTSKNSVYYRRIREGSLITGKENRYTIKKCLNRIGAYMIIFCRNPLKYNFLFFVSRILATLKSLIKFS
jgi:glycosyltransferase involved in cell wall biosynthesis